MTTFLILLCVLTVTIYSMEQEEIGLSQAHSKATTENVIKEEVDLPLLLSTKSLHYSHSASSPDNHLVCGGR